MAGSPWLLVPVLVPVLVLALLGGGEGSLRSVYPRLRASPPGRGDCGKPLLVTPLLLLGRADEARELAEVRDPRFLGVVSYAGFFTVNITSDSAQFFWYFPAETATAAAPVVLWLQGGPGASSLFGMFTENGPLEYRRGRLGRRTVSWTHSHHVIYVDNPVGTGFSYTRDGFAADQTAVGNELDLSLRQFFTMFPDLQKNEFFVTGESYAGKYVPAVCRVIRERNLDGSLPSINLQGFAIGNGLSDPLHQVNYGPYLYRLGLLDAAGLKAFEEGHDSLVAAIEQENWSQASDDFDALIDGDFTSSGSLFFNLTGFKNYFNFLKDGDNDLDDFSELFQDCDFRRALHVGNLTFHDGSEVESHMKDDMMKSVAPWVAELLEHYRGVIYNGQLDIIVAYPLTENYLAHLNFSSAAEYAKAQRGQWRVGKWLAGYAKVAGNLTEVLVRNAGHMVPHDQPLAAADLLSRLTANKPFF